MGYSVRLELCDTFAYFKLQISSSGYSAMTLWVLEKSGLGFVFLLSHLFFPKQSVNR